jgi:hypothetical protein
MIPNIGIFSKLQQIRRHRHNSGRRFVLISPLNKVDNIPVPVFNPEHIPELSFELRVCDPPLHCAGQAISKEFPGLKNVLVAFHFRPFLRILQFRHWYETRKVRSQHDGIVSIEIENPDRPTQAAQLEDLINWRVDLG